MIGFSQNDPAANYASITRAPFGELHGFSYFSGVFIFWFVPIHVFIFGHW
jgi:hypothetical protein